MANTEEKMVIFVCTGNTCRSPMAEVLFRHEIKRRGLPVSVRSAGTDAAAQGSMHLHSLRTLSAHGLLVENFAPTQLTLEMVQDAHAVICMTKDQKDLVSYHTIRHFGLMEGVHEKVYAFSDFCGYSIPDPYGYPIEMYESTFAALEGGMSAIIDRLFPVEPKTEPKKAAPKKKAAAKKAGEKTAAKSSVNKSTGKKSTGQKKAASGAKTTPKTTSKTTTKKKATGTRKSAPKKENDTK